MYFYKRLFSLVFCSLKVAFCLSLALLCVPLYSCSPLSRKESPEPLSKIEHIIVIYAENRSFDNLYGLFPHANGIHQATPEQYIQINHDSKPLPFLPPISEKGKHLSIDAKLPNKPFQIDAPPINLPLSARTRDLTHSFYQNQEQINDGKNNLFAAISDAGGLTMGYYDGSKLPLWQEAQTYVLADNFFMGAFGGSFINHQWLICACTPYDNSAPFELRAKLDEKGHLLRKSNSPTSAMQGAPSFYDAVFTPDGYAVNTRQPPYQPSGIKPAINSDLQYADQSKIPLPPQTTKTLGDTLSAKDISWAWFAEGWSAAITDGQQAPTNKRNVIYNEHDNALNFQAHHQPFNYFKRFEPGRRDRTEHLKDSEDFFKALNKGTLPHVSFYKPSGRYNEHAGYSDILAGDAHIAQVVTRIKHSPLWDKTAIIVTYDENGGFWDHVAPPKGDRWGPGTRIPALIISPFAKRSFIDHTYYDTTSIIKFITRRFNLEPLPGVRKQAGDLYNAFEIRL